MGNIWGRRPGAVGPSVFESSAVELYNQLQDTRQLILVVDTTADVLPMDDEAAEVSFLPPERFKQLLVEEIANRRARGWTVAVLSDGNPSQAQEIQRWICESGLGCGRDIRDSSDLLVKEVRRVAGTAEGFYDLFPWLSRQHPFFEAGRLYPSLIARQNGTYLFLSNFGVASDPYIYHALNIKFVVNCSRDLPFVDEVAAILQANPRTQESQKAIRTDLTVELSDRLRVPVDDSVEHQICDYFAEGVQFIAKAMEKQDGHVLIHCKHGQSRSATIAAAYLLYDAQKTGKSKTVEDVLRELKGCRPRISPNEGFLKQLQGAF